MKTTPISPVQCHLKDQVVHELQKVGFLFTTKFCGDIFTVQFLSPEKRDPSIDKSIPVEQEQVHIPAAKEIHVFVLEQRYRNHQCSILPFCASDSCS